MEKYMTDERTGITYELVGNYYLIAGDEERPVGIWGQRHRKYIQDCHRGLYIGLLLSGKLEAYLAEVNERADEMFLWIVKALAEKEGITEALKAADQMEWVRRMNSISTRAREIVNEELILA